MVLLPINRRTGGCSTAATCKITFATFAGSLDLLILIPLRDICRLLRLPRRRDKPMPAILNYLGEAATEST
jgi:hypothetical protein